MPLSKSHKTSEIQFPYLKKKVNGNHVSTFEGMIHMKAPGLLGLSLERLGGVCKWKVGEERESLKLKEHRVQRSRGVSEWSVRAII